MVDDARSELAELLRRHSVATEPNIVCTEGGKYRVDMEEFWPLYNTMYEAGQSLCLAQQPAKDNKSVLRFDVDFLTGNSERWYDDADITAIRSAINDAIKFFVVPKRQLRCCLLEKKSRGDKHDGVHIVYPHLIMTGRLRKAIFNRVASTAKPGIRYDDMTNSAWMILGATKKTVSGLDTAYRFTRLFDDDEELVPRHDFVVAFYSQPSAYCVNREPTAEDEVFDLDDEEPITKKRKLSTDSRALSDDPSECILDKIEAEQILQNLNRSRIDTYADWLDVGIILYSISQGSQRALKMWDEWSQSGSTYSPTVCYEKWKSFSSFRRTIGSLYYLLKTDNEDHYNGIIYDSNRVFIESTIKTAEEGGTTDATKLPTLTNCDIAEMFMRLAQHEYIYAKIGNKSGAWYSYSRFKHKWERQTTNICMKMKAVVEPHIMKIIDDLSHSKPRKAKAYAQFKKRAYMQIGSTSFLRGCEEAARSLMYDTEFYGLLDMNKLLIGCTNGVLDAGSGVFRNGQPDDYISLTTLIEYPISVNDDDKRMLYELFRKLFYTVETSKDGTEIEIPVYLNVLEILSSITFCSDKQIIFSLGPTNVGKTQTMNLIKAALGEYARTLPKDILTQKNLNSSGPKPELSRIRGARIISINEMSDKTAFNPGTVKELSGGDPIFVRGLYEDGTELLATWTLWISTNSIPKISPDEKALWTRIMILMFRSEFIDTPKDSYKNKKFKKESKAAMEAIVKRLAPVLLHVIFETVKTNRNLTEEMAKPCALILEDTREYIKNSDPFVTFIEKTIVKKEGKSIELSHTHLIFCDWYANSYRGEKKFDQRAFRSSFENATELALKHRFTFVSKKIDRKFVDICYGLSYVDEFT